MPFMWTRIMKVEALQRSGDEVDEEQVEIFEIEEDAHYVYQVPLNLTN